MSHDYEFSRKKKLDFSIYKDSHKKKKIRFYPKRSRLGVLSSKEMGYEETYKVFYSWAILESKNVAWEDEEPRWSKYKKVFVMEWDDCSVLFEVLKGAIETVVGGKEKHLGVVSTGQPSSEWILEYHEISSLFKEGKGLDDWVSFMVFNNWTSKGYRFNLNVGDIPSFIDYLNSINRYMLKYSEPIKEKYQSQEVLELENLEQGYSDSV